MKTEEKKTSENAVALQMDHSAEILDHLKKAYNMELETVLSYVANSINLDGIRAEEIKEALKEDITAELGHAQRLGNRIRVLGGICPGSQQLKMEQTSLQPKTDTADIISVIKGVIEAEEAACKQYEKIIEACDGIDYVTQDLCIDLLGDEQEHRREFVGFLREFEKNAGK